MDLGNKILIVGVSFQAPKDPPTLEHWFADILIIDRSNDVLQPQVYEIKNPNQHAFAFMGEVKLIDKEEKIIHLMNNNTISYKHLILASGLSNTVLGSIHDKDCSAALIALDEAIRMRKNLPQGRNPVKNPGKERQITIKDSTPEERISSLVKIFSSKEAQNNPEKTLQQVFSKTNMRLYEILL